MMEPIEKRHENEHDNCDVIDEKTLKMESDILPFLKGLKLEEYYESMVNNGGDKLGQLIYVDEHTIDQFCSEINMKVIHAGVFKKALRECKNSSRGNNFEHERPVRTEHPPMYPMHPHYLHPAYQESQFQFIDRRRVLMGLDHNYHPPQHPPIPMHPPEHLHYFRKNTPNQDGISRPMFPIEDLKNEERPFDNGTQLSKNSSDHPPSFNDTLSDGSYFVTVQDKTIKFPPTVKRLTIIDRMDSERMDVIKKGSQIYGRDDTKRKNNELTPLEQFMNEISFEICVRDFTYMISRQKLLGLVREIVKENQVQFSINHTNSNFSQISTRKSEKIKIPIVNFPIENGGSPPTMIQSEQQKKYSMPGMSDYDIILYHKKHREWPQGISKEYRKYLGRRSSNFDLVDGVLYYNKDHKKRRWVDGVEEIQKAFLEGHIDYETNIHYTKEATTERLNQKYYFKNMNNQIGDMLLQCQFCQEKHRAVVEDTNKRKTSRVSSNIEEFHVISVLPTEINPDIPVVSELNNSVNFSDSTQVTEEPPAKKSRKSVPKKLESQDFDILLGRNSILKTDAKEIQENNDDLAPRENPESEFNTSDIRNCIESDLPLESSKDCNMAEIST